MSAHRPTPRPAEPDQGTLFSEPAIVGPIIRVTNTGPALNDHTADRGHGAPAYRTARDAVQQEAVKMGMSDRGDWRTQKRLNPEEKKALGSAHPEMFAFVPGSQTVAPKIVDIFAGFHTEYDKWVRKARESFAGVTDYAVKQYAVAHAVSLTHDQEKGHVLTVDRGGYRFSTHGSFLPDVLDALARRVKGGPDLADGPTPAAPKEEKTALERMWEREGPEMQAKRQALFYFRHRWALFRDRQEQGIEFHLIEKDWEIAEKIGIERADERTFRELGRDGVAQALFNEVYRRTRVVEEVLDEGLSKALLPGESMQRVTEDVGRAEQAANDRYYGKRDNPVVVAE